MQEEHDNKNQRCRRLGHTLSFRYCRGGEGTGVCRLILDCWWERFDVRAFMEKHLPADLERLENTQPEPKIASILDLIEKAVSLKKEGSPDESES